jgi:threonine dehydratase
VAVEEKDSLADALLGGIGLDNRYSFPMVKKYVDTIELVTEEEIERGLVHAFLHHGLLIEGAAAVTLAWLQKNKTQWLGNSIIGILSGGNMDTDLFLSILARHTNRIESSGIS